MWVSNESYKIFIKGVLMFNKFDITIIEFEKNRKDLSRNLFKQHQKFTFAEKYRKTCINPACLPTNIKIKQVNYLKY